MSDDNATEDEVTIKKRKISIACDVDAPKRLRLVADDDATGSGSGFVAVSVPSRSLVDTAIANTLVDRRQFRRVGPYILGPKIGCSPVDSIVQYLAKREGTNEFVQLKVIVWNRMAIRFLAAKCKIIFLDPNAF